MGSFTAYKIKSNLPSSAFKALQDGPQFLIASVQISFLAAEQNILLLAE